MQFAISFGCVPTLSRSIITIPTFIDERSGLPVRLLVNKHEGIKPERLSAVIYTRKAHFGQCVHMIVCALVTDRGSRMADARP